MDFNLATSRTALFDKRSSLWLWIALVAIAFLLFALPYSPKRYPGISDGTAMQKRTVAQNFIRLETKMIHEIVAAMSNRASISDLVTAIHAYPTFAEGIKVAAESWIERKTSAAALNHSK
jgi:hypothetical protein